jgi:hypothetical protein
VIGEQEQPEPNLGDEQRLRERKQVRDDAARLPVAVVRKAGERGGAECRRQDEECNGVVGR